MYLEQQGGISMEIVLGLIGGLLYTWIEMLWRGYTHWTMFLLGGGCFVVLGLLNEYKIPWHWCRFAAGGSGGMHRYRVRVYNRLYS